MKRLILICVMVLSALLCTSACAEKTITAMASPVNPEHLEKASCYVRILGYDAEQNTLSVELIVQEVFSEDDILGLEIGDSIFTGDEEILIRTIDWYEDDFYLVINAGDYEHAPGSIYLHEYWDNYRPDRYGHPTYNTLAVIDCPVADTLLFLDYTSEETHDALELPIVRTAAEFLEIFFGDNTDSDKYEVGLNIDNVYVVFDGDGQLAVIARFFVSWM